MSRISLAILLAITTLHIAAPAASHPPSMYALTQNCVSAGFASDADCRFLPAIESNGAQWIAAHRASARSTERAARACRAAYGRGTRAAAPAGLTYDACQGLILITALHDNRIPIFLPPKGAKS